MGAHLSAMALSVALIYAGEIVELVEMELYAMLQLTAVTNAMFSRAFQIARTRLVEMMDVEEAAVTAQEDNYVFMRRVYVKILVTAITWCPLALNAIPLSIVALTVNAMSSMRADRILW